MDAGQHVGPVPVFPPADAPSRTVRLARGLAAGRAVCDASGCLDNEAMRIRAVQACELPFLQEIERAAGQPFADIGMVEIARDEPYPLAVLAACEQAGLLWVTVDEADKPVAYLMASVVDECLHIDQVSVQPDSARRRLGRALLDHAAGRAATDGLAALTLTTFASVPWNAPYYRRCGFRVLDEAELTPGLRAIRQHEAGLGLDKWPRVCMRRDL